MGLLIDVTSVSIPEPDPEELWGRHVDFPVEGNRNEAFAFDIAGWLLSKKSRAIAVEIKSNGELIRRLPLNFPRPDLAEGYPDARNAARGGFRATVNLLGPRPDVELELDAVLRNRQRVPIGVIRGKRSWRSASDPSIAGLVSVIIPCYNQAHFLGEAIESVLAQTYPHFEIVVINDGSTDNTPEIVARYPGVRYVFQENRGLSATRNTGIRRSNGNFLVFLDADDRLLPRALEAGLECLEAHPECAFAWGRARRIATDGAPLPYSESPCEGPDYYRALLHQNCISPPGAVVYRRSVFEYLGGFDTSISPSADWDLYLRIARDFPVCSYEELVAEYRLHGGEMSRDAAAMLQTTIAVLHSQRKHARNRKEYRKAYRMGLRHARRYYGDQVVSSARLHLSEGRWRKAISGIAWLVRYYRRGLASLLRPGFAR